MSEKIERTPEQRERNRLTVARWRKNKPELDLASRYRQSLRFCEKYEAQHPVEAVEQQKRVWGEA